MTKEQFDRAEAIKSTLYDIDKRIGLINGFRSVAQKSAKDGFIRLDAEYGSVHAFFPVAGVTDLVDAEIRRLRMVRASLVDEFEEL